MKKNRFRVFTRTWWIANNDWPDGREPSPGRKTTIDYVSTEREAQRACAEWNANHKPGKLSRKAEYEGY
jgi:hypothetical protein